MVKKIGILVLFFVLSQKTGLRSQAETRLINPFYQVESFEEEAFPNGAQALAQLLLYYEAPKYPLGTVNYWNATSKLGINYHELVWNYSTFKNDQDSLKSWLKQLDIGLRSWTSNLVRQTNWAAFTVFLKEQLNYTVQEESVSGRLFTNVNILQDYLSQGMPILARLRRDKTMAYHYVVIDGFRQKNGQSELHILGCHPDFPTAWYSDTKAYPLDQFPDLDHFLLISPNRTTPQEFSVEEVDQEFVSLRWEANDSTVYQLIRYPEDRPTQKSLLLSWESGSDYFDTNILPGERLIYELRAAANGLGEQASPFSKVRVEVPGIVCPDSIWLADRVTDLALIEWQGPLTQEYQLVQFEERDTLLLSPWMSDQTFLLGDIPEQKDMLLGLRTRHYLYPGTLQCPEKIFIPKRQSLTGTSFQASKGTFAEKVELSWDSSLGSVAVQRYKTGKWVNVIIDAPGSTYDVPDSLGGLILYRLIQVDEFNQDTQLIARDVGYVEEKLILPDSFSFDVTTYNGRRKVSLDWTFSADSVRIWRSFAEAPLEISPISQWLPNIDTYVDQAVFFNRNYIYALQFKTGEIVSVVSSKNGARIQSGHHLDDLKSYRLGCADSQVLTTDTDQISALRGTGADLSGSDLILLVSEDLRSRRNKEIEISSGGSMFQVFLVKDNNGIFERVAHYQSLYSTTVYLADLSVDFDFILIESSEKFEFFSIETHCNGELVSPDTCILGKEYDVANTLDANFNSFNYFDRYECDTQEYPGKEIIYSYSADPFFADDTLDLYLTVSDYLADELAIFISQDCSGFSKCDLLEEYRYTKGQDKILHQRFLWDPTQSVQIIIDSKLDTGYIFELEIEVDNPNLTPGYWSDFQIETICKGQDEETYQLVLFFQDSSKVLEVLPSSFTVIDTAFNRFIFQELPSEEIISLDYIIRDSSGLRAPGAILSTGKNCGCNDFPAVVLESPVKYCVDTTILAYRAILQVNEQARWYFEDEVIGGYINDQQLTLSSFNDFYLQIRDTLTGCNSYRQSIPIHKIKKQFDLEVNVVDGSCKMPGQIEVSPEADYYYHWAHQPLLSGPMATGLPSGQYELELVDKDLCAEQLYFVVEQEDTQILDSIGIHPEVCRGKNGEIQLYQNDPSTRSFINKIETHELSGLSESVNNLLAFNEQGCILDSMVYISYKAPWRIDSISVLPTTCGENNGEIALHIPDELSLEINWFDQPGLEVSQRAGLPAGLYQVEVASAHNCLDTIEFQIEESLPAIADLEMEIVPYSCNEPGLFLKTDQALNLYWKESLIPAQNYIAFPGGQRTLIYEDEYGCREEIDFFIPEITSGTRLFTPIKEDTCNQEMGEIDARYFSFIEEKVNLLVDGEDATGENLSKGVHYFAFTNELGCIVQDTFLIGNRVPYETSVDIIGEECGIQNTVVKVEINNNPPDSYKIKWAGNKISEDSLLVDRNGEFGILVTNELECADSVWFEVAATPELALNLLDVNPPNCLLNNGEITPSVSGGTIPYSMMWNDGVIGDYRDSLAPGSYILTVTDINGCTIIDSVALFNQNVYDIDASLASPACFGGNDGHIELSLLSDTVYENVEFLWQDGADGAIRSQLENGTYFVRVNADGCLSDWQFILYEPPVLVLSSIMDIRECEGNSIVLEPTITGGTPPYTTYLNGALFSNDTSFIVDRTSNDFLVEVEDSNHCLTDQFVSLSVFPKPRLIQLVDSIFVEGEQVDLIIQDFPEINWQGLPYGICNNCSRISFTANEDLNIFLTVVDRNGCPWQDTSNIQVVQRYLDIFPAVNVITPNGDGIHDALIFDKIDRFSNTRLTIFNKWGNIIFSTKNYQNNWEGTDENGNELPAGEYYYILQVEQEILKSYLQIVRE